MSGLFDYPTIVKDYFASTIRSRGFELAGLSMSSGEVGSGAMIHLTLADDEAEYSVPVVYLSPDVIGDTLELLLGTVSGLRAAAFAEQCS